MSEIKALQNDIELKKGTLDRVNLEAKVYVIHINFNPAAYNHLARYSYS